MSNKNIIPPIKFTPIYKEVLWGGDKIAQFKGIKLSSNSIGESWEVSGVNGKETVVAEGEHKGKLLSEIIDIYKADFVGASNYARFGNLFPLLIKFIHADKDLSLQVHPNDDFAKEHHNGLGKTEMWYIISAENDATICSGLKKHINSAEYIRRVENDTMMDVISRHKSHPGDIFYIPAGRIHSICAGNLLLEVQQTSDITYRIYDYNRRDANGNPRELHTDLAKQVIDYNVYDQYVTNVNHEMRGMTHLMRCNYFDVNRIILEDGKPYTVNVSINDSFLAVICINGATDITDSNGFRTSIKRGETVIIPASTQFITLSGDATIITTSTL